LRILLGLLISLGALNAHAQREFNQAELDAVLAPIALYPDPLLTNILNASLFPADVAAAAAWSRANPQLQGDAALAAVEGAQWHPSVKALVANPEVLARMAESPQWLADLGEAYSGSAAAVDAGIQNLRARAQASGNLQSSEQQYVYQQGQDIVVQPMYPQVLYAPYYNPYIVYGTWWWPAYRPVYWRPWVARPVYVTRVVQPVRIVRPGHLWHGPARIARPGPVVTPYHAVPESRRQPIIQSRTRPMAQAPSIPQHGFARVTHEVRRTPLAQNAPVARPMPAPQARATERRPPQTMARAGGNSAGWNGGGNRGFGQAGRQGNSAGNGGGRHRG
jgi:hypothetical protein